MGDWLHWILIASNLFWMLLARWAGRGWRDALKDLEEQRRHCLEWQACFRDVDQQQGEPL